MLQHLEVKKSYARILFIDFSSAGIRHALADLAAFPLLFPTCFCAGDIPSFFVEMIIEEYRHTLLKIVTLYLVILEISLQFGLKNTPKLMIYHFK